MSNQLATGLPVGWSSATLGQVSECILGGTPSTEVRQFWGGDVPWMASGDVHLRRVTDVPGRITALGLRSSNATLTSPPAVAVGLAGQGKTRGTVALTLCTLSTNQSIALLKTNGSDLRSDYLFHNLDRRYEELRARSSGGGRGGLSKAILEAVPIELPPLSEQQKVAQILDTLDTAIHETEAIIAKLKAVKQGLLHDLLTRGIAANGELRPPQVEAPHIYKESPLGWIPKEWDFAPLVSKIDFPEGQVDPRRVPYRDWVLIAPDHIESGTGRLISTATAAEQQAISGKYVFQSGDVIYSKIRPYLRKAVLASNSGLCSADMYPLRPKTGIDSRYLLAVILGDQYSRFAESVSMRSGFPKINRNEMAEFSIGWPSSDEQSWIAHILSDADIKQRTEEDQLEKLRLLKAGLMDDLLTGRVRVTPLLTEAAQQPGSS